MRTFILFLFSIQMVTAQKVVKKSIADKAISSFQIDATNCFKIDIKTSNSDEVVVAARIEGEYRKDLVLNVNEGGNTILVNAGFQTNFEKPNDKLSAHKVVSIALQISLPVNKQAHIFGTSATVTATGSYDELKITLNDGASYLYDVKGSARVNSQSGDIRVESVSAKIFSNSKYGKVGENQIPTGDNKYLLNTVTGDIGFKRIE